MCMYFEFTEQEGYWHYNEQYKLNKIDWTIQIKYGKSCTEV